MFRVRKICETTILIVTLLFLTWYITKDIVWWLNLEDQQHQPHQSPAMTIKSSPIDLKLRGQLKSLLKCYDKPLKRKILQRGDYWVVQNFVRGRLSIGMGCADAITYTTTADFRFMGHLATVVKRWLGPVSFALFAPGYDFNDTMESIQYVRNCLPESQLIRDFVSFHVFYPSEHEPYDVVPPTEEDALEFPYDCEGHIPYEDVNVNYLYRTSANLTFPINVGRNIARKAAITHFVFPCDIELYPSLGLIPSFLRMVAKKAALWRDRHQPRVFAFPVFELESNARLPDTKAQLVAMLKSRQAFPFHEMFCKYCNFVPHQNRWVQAKTTTKQMEIFHVTKRQGKAMYWEPFYISDNKEPDFDERIPWEAQTSKRVQNYAMCLLDYEYHILHPAFLVHSPGIADYEPSSERMIFVQYMNTVIVEEIVPGYQILYGSNKKCMV